MWTHEKEQDFETKEDLHQWVTRQHGSVYCVEDESHLPHEDSGHETFQPLHEGTRHLIQ